MTIWVRALCAKSLDSVTADELRAGIAARLPTLAEYYGEEGHEAALARLRVEKASSKGWEIHYRADDGALDVERWTAPAEVREEVGELLERLEDCDEEDVDEVRELLGRVVESAALELKMSDVEGIGWPVAIAAAATLAERGEGVIQADGEGWMEPSGLGVDQVLDGD